MAAEIGLRTYLKERHNISVHLQIDNTSALSYIKKMGGTNNIVMIDITKRIWTFLLRKKISLTVEYIPSELNTAADWESRNWVDSSEWSLNQSVFKDICTHWGEPEIDLFASRISHKTR